MILYFDFFKTKTLIKPEKSDFVLENYLCGNYNATLSTKLGAFLLPSIPWLIKNLIQELSGFYQISYSPSFEHWLNKWDDWMTVRLQLSDKDTLGQDITTHLPLFEYQKVGVAYIEHCFNSGQKGVLLADEMGLGKTPTIIEWLLQHPELRPVLIVCPAYLQLNWAKEIQKFAPHLTIEVTDGTKLYNQKADIFIVSYTSLFAFSDKINPIITVFDESHYISNVRSNRYQSASTFVNQSKFVIFSTGTPIKNGRPIELWSTLKLALPTHFNDFFFYALRYCGAKETQWGWDFSGATNIDELNKILRSTLMVRREKQDVLKELPPKTRQILYFNIKTVEYIKAEQDFLGWVQEQIALEKELHGFSEEEAALALTRIKRGEALIKSEVLKQLAVEAKLPMIIEWIDNFINNSSNKLIIFAVHKKVIQQLQEHLKRKCVVVTGDVPKKKKFERAERFMQDPKVQVFIGNIAAASTGLTLTSAHNVLFVELPWTPGDLLQAEDRAHRLTQNYPVTCYYTLISDSIEERIYNLIEKKALIEKWCLS